ncbi:MAG TPA: tetratricopeptide repeat protein [Chitinophagales bacterium]|nr:tetratricopeptide repeat protein [Chitinophagales bacterium]
MLKIKFFSFCLLLLPGAALHLTGCNPEQPKEKTETPPTSEFAQIPIIQNLSEKIAENPEDEELLYARSNAYLQLGNYQNALADIVAAIKLDSTNGKFYSTLGEIYFSKQEYTRAITALEKGHKQNPDDIELTLQLAKYQLYVGEKAKSIQLLDEVLKKNMFYAEAYFLKGMVFKEIGDTSKAISNFQTAVEQNPNYYDAYMQLGLLLTKKKNKLAPDYFSNALKIDSTSYEARYGIAMYYQEVKNYTKALELYRQMILDYPQDKDAYYNTGYIYFQMDSLEKAARSFERAIGVDPTYADAYYMRGLCAEAAKDFKNARYYYQQALNLIPEHALAAAAMKRLGNL